MKKFKHLFLVCCLVFALLCLNGCSIARFFSEVEDANKLTAQNEVEITKYLQDKYRRQVKVIITDENHGGTMKPRPFKRFSVEFEGDNFKFSASAEENVTDTYLSDKWDYQMTERYKDQVSEEILKAFKAEYPENSLLEVPVVLEWNHEKELYNADFEIPNALLDMSIQDLYSKGFISNTKFTQHTWIKENDLEYEKSKLISYMPEMAKKLGSPDMNITAYYHIYSDKINVDIKKLQNTQTFGVLGNWDEYKRYFVELKNITGAVNGEYKNVWMNNTIHTDTFHSANDYDMENNLRELCNSKELHEAISNNRNFLSELKYNKQDIEEAIQDQLNSKYRKSNSYEVQNIVVTEQPFQNAKLAYMRVMVKDTYNTEFIAIVDCSDYRNSPTICMDNYLERFIENYLEEDYFKLNNLDVSNYCVGGSFIISDAKYRTAIENFRADKYQDLICTANEYSIKILLSKSKHRIDEQLLKTLQDKRDAMWKSGMQNLENGVFVFRINTEYNAPRCQDTQNRFLS